VSTLAARAAAGAGLVLAPLAAVSAEGRITLGCAGLYRPEHLEAWRQLVARVHAQAGTLVTLRLGHAGRRGATRPRASGLDRPLRAEAWPLLAPSALPYTPRSQVPRAMERGDMDQVREDFVRAARMAAEAGCDLLELHLAHGYLLASFLSPLTNRRADAYGGTLENRMRYPLEVLDAVRAVWPAERPLAVALGATDWAPGGLDVDDAISIAAALKAHGCDLIEVLGGQTTPDAEPPYGRGFLTALGDRMRNGARIPTLVGGYLTTTGEINAMLAAGRADLCIMESPELAELWEDDASGTPVVDTTSAPARERVGKAIRRAR
jgi:anthraniloyl-CoA monooxygenase